MSLAYDRSGRGPTLVLLHGLGHHRHAWDPLLPTLTRFRDVITVDLPGHGESPPLPAGTVVDLAALLESVRQLFAELDLDHPHVAGSSLGGRLALELARDGHARSATALGPAGFWAMGAELGYTLAVLRGVRRLGRVLEPFAPAITGNRLGRSLAFALFRARPWRLSPAQALQDSRAFQSCAHFDAILANATPYRPGPEPEVPITVVWGTRDFILPRWQAHRAQTRAPAGPA